MRKFAFVVLVLAFALPAMAANDVVLSFTKTPDVNTVVLNYKFNNGKEARAFALDIAVTDSAYVVGSVVSQSNDFYIHPTNITFDVNSGGITYIKDNGSPAVNETVNGFTLEMASLYAAGDPNHPAAPPATGSLVSFKIDSKCAGNADRKIMFTVTENAQRGGIVNIDPNIALTKTMPSATFYLPCLDCACMVVTTPATVCGGVPITTTRLTNWVTVGKPGSWCHPAHYAGDCNLDCKVNAADVSGPALPNFAAAFGATYPAANYQAACDITEDKKVNATDISGSVSIPNSGLAPNFGLTIAGCP